MSFKFEHKSSKLVPKIDLVFKCRTLNDVDSCVQKLLKSLISNNLHILYIDNEAKYRCINKLL